MDGALPDLTDAAQADRDRVAALRAYGVLDTPTEAAFDDITAIAAHVCGTPFAVVNLIDQGRQWFKSEIGFGVRETPLDTSICAHAILQPGLFEVPDLADDERFACNPLITGEPKLRFYAGALLRTPDGLALGTVCVLDTVPRRLDERQRATLLALARQTMAQLELRKALAAADRAARHRSRLMAVAGHDLRQPLQVVVAVLDRQLRRATDESDRTRLGAGLEAARRMRSDLGDLARASELSVEEAGPRLEPFPLSRVLARVEPVWGLSADLKGLDLVVQHSNAVVVSDPEMLATVVNNLVGNAVKYTDRGTVTVSASVRDGAVELAVVDTGAGIAADQLPSIFEAFRQLDARAEGLGLGLSIVRRTTELLGHPLSVKSELGTGSAFTVILPLA